MDLYSAIVGMLFGTGFLFLGLAAFCCSIGYVCENYSQAQSGNANLIWQLELTTNRMETEIRILRGELLSVAGTINRTSETV